MVSARESHSISPQAREALRTSAARIRAGGSARLLWQRVLTAEDRNRLGGDLERAFRRFGTAGMWMQLRSVSVERAVVDVARDLDFLSDADYRWLLQELGESSDEPDSLIGQKRATTALVIVMGPGRRELYWHAELVNVDWFKRDAAWRFLVALAERARVQLGADAFDMEGQFTGSLKDVRHRIKVAKLLPPSLEKKIKPAGCGTYRIDLEPAQLCVLEFQQQDRLVVAAT